MYSRSNAVLTRIREMDKKYRSSVEKTLEQFSDISTISTNEKSEVSKKSPTILKPRLNIKLPETFHEKLDSFVSNPIIGDDFPVTVFVKKSELSSFESSLKSQEVNEKTKEIVRSFDHQNSKSEDFSFCTEEIEDLSNDSDQESTNNVVEHISMIESVFESENIQVVDEKLIKISQKTSETHDEFFDEEKTTFESYSEDSFESESSETETETDSVITKNFVEEDSRKSLLENPKTNSPISIFEFKNYSIRSEEKESILDTLKEEKKSEHEKILDIEENVNEYAQNRTEEINLTDDSKSISLKKDKKFMGKKKKKKKDFKYKQLKKKEYSGVCSKSILNEEEQKIILNTDLKECKQKQSNDCKINSIPIESNRRRSKKLTTSQKTLSKKEKGYLSMARYLKKVEEDRLKFMVWPTNFVCSNNSRAAIFTPMELPKISNFIQPVNSPHFINDNQDSNIKILQSRLFNIRQWLKDQYFIYKDQCELANSINSNYSSLNL